MRKRVFGKLTAVQTVEKSDGTFLHLCKCVCGQTVLASETDLKVKRSCSSCEVRTVLRRLKSDDIALFRNAIGAIPYGEQVLIIRRVGNDFAVEYRGKLYNCRADELEPLGVNFHLPTALVRRILKRKCQTRKKK